MYVTVCVIVQTRYNYVLFFLRNSVLVPAVLLDRKEPAQPHICTHTHTHTRAHTHNISIDLIWTATAQTRHKKVLANNYMCSVCKVKEMILIVLLCTSRCLYTKIYRYYNILYFVEFNYLVLVAQQIVVEVLRSSSKLIKFLHKIHVQ